jgi:hypothetical protein
MTVNPVFASIVGALVVGEGIGPNLIVGLAAVAIGIPSGAADVRFRE